MNTPSALAGLSAEELKSRRDIGPSDFWGRDGSLLAQNLKSRNEEARRRILATYEELLQRARSFKWDNYIAQLKVDGRLSSAEARHMEIVKSIFDQRIERLADSREAFATFLGIDNE
jgi:hypothetical protein